MTHQLGLGRAHSRVAVATVASLALAGLAASTSYAHANATGAHRVAVPGDPYVDVTGQDGVAPASSLEAASRVAGRPAAQAFLAAQPPGVVRDISGTTGTVRFLADLDGYLTPKSTSPPRRIALRYVRDNATDLNLTPDD